VQRDCASAIGLSWLDTRVFQGAPKPCHASNPFVGHDKGRQRPLLLKQLIAPGVATRFAPLIVVVLPWRMEDGDHFLRGRDAL
jgi:hypothetical protein